MRLLASTGKSLKVAGKDLVSVLAQLIVNLRAREELCNSGLGVWVAQMPQAMKGSVLGVVVGGAQLCAQGGEHRILDAMILRIFTGLAIAAVVPVREAIPKHVRHGSDVGPLE
jgi:hypothetical protein